MDPTLLQLLQAMKCVEDNPLSESFKTKTIDLASFIPMYPNVMVVDQRESRTSDILPFVPATTRLTSTSPESPVKNEFITDTIRRSISVLNPRWAPSVEGGWTIILKEGLYIDPIMIGVSHVSTNPNLQIVGLNQVRILFVDRIKNIPPITVVNAKLTLQNVRLYDIWRINLKGCSPYVISVNDGAQLTLNNVLIHAPFSGALHAKGKGTRVSLNNCVLRRCRMGFLGEHGCEIRMEDCSVSENRVEGISLYKGCKIIALKSQFVNFFRFDVMVQSQCLLDRCEFEKAPRDPDPEDQKDRERDALQVFDSKLTCSKTSFRGFQRVADLTGSDCHALFKACTISDAFCFIDASENASVSAYENHIHSVTSLLEISVNVKGDVKFLRNKLVSNGPPIYGIDSVSRKPNIDHDPLLIVERDLMPQTPSDKKRSEFTKDIRNHYQQLNQRSNASVSFDVSKYKRCKKCLRFENIY